ncbi:hypothetical protein ACFWX8_42700, partial [Streptomyces violascens]
SRQTLILADRAYRGAGATIRTPHYGHDLPYAQFNEDHARLRAPGEPAFTRPKSRRIFRKARCTARESPSRASQGGSGLRDADRE